MWKWQHLCKTGRCVCEIDCSVFSDTKSLRKARQAPLGQISLSCSQKLVSRIRERISSRSVAATENTKLGDIMHFSDERDRIAPVLSCQDKGRRGMEEKLVFWVESGSNSKSSVCGGRDPFILLLVAGVTSCLYNGYVLKKNPWCYHQQSV